MSDNLRPIPGEVRHSKTWEQLLLVRQHALRLVQSCVYSINPALAAF